MWGHGTSSANGQQFDFWCTLSLRLKDTHKHKDPVRRAYEFKITTSEWVFSKPVQNVVMVITNASETLAKHCTSLPYFFSAEFQNLLQLLELNRFKIFMAKMPT